MGQTYISSVCESSQQESSEDGLISEVTWESDLSGPVDLRPEEERLQGEGAMRRVQSEGGGGMAVSRDLE